MLRDIERGSVTEGNHILDDFAARARALGVVTPILDLACVHVAAYEAGRAREARSSIVKRAAWRVQKSGALCRCPIEESRFLPDRDVTSDGRLSGAKRHHCPWLGASGGVKGQSRLAGARSAALEAATRAQHTSKC
jgi:hypothetical protein